MTAGAWFVILCILQMIDIELTTGILMRGGMANPAKFFLLDEQGNARAPSNPVRVFAGMGL